MTAFSEDMFGHLTWNSGALPYPLPAGPPAKRRWASKWIVVSESSRSDKEDRGARETNLEEAQERDCIEQTRRGDTQAFDVLVDKYSTRIYTHLFRLLGNREEAEDLTQETFLRAYRFLHRYDAARPFRAWLYTIATNVGLNAIRSRKRRGQPISIDRLEEMRREEAVVSKETALTRVTDAELRERLAKAVSRLPEKSSLLVHLHYSEQMTIREASEIAGMTESAAKVALHRARQTLREYFTRNEET